MQPTENIPDHAVYKLQYDLGANYTRVPMPYILCGENYQLPKISQSSTKDNLEALKYKACMP